MAKMSSGGVFLRNSLSGVPDPVGVVGDFWGLKSMVSASMGFWI